MAKALVGFSSDMSFDMLGNPIFKTITHLSDGSNLQKTLSFGDYKELLGMATKVVEDNYVTIPKLPKYFHEGGATKKQDSFWVALFVPSSKKQFYYQTTGEMLFVPYPNMLFLLKVKKGVVSSKFCYAVADSELKDDSVMYQYPYGHVDIDGSICMGSCSKKIALISKADSFVEQFILGANQGHYYTNNQMTLKDVSLRELLGLVEKKGYFPSEWLKPIETKERQTTYKEAKEIFLNMKY